MICIYDRTLADVAYVYDNQGSDLELKGALNVSDLNRIESNTLWLHQQLESYDYHSGITVTKTNWVNTDFIYLVDIDRIRQNIIDIVACYNTFSTTPVLTTGGQPLTYLHINDIEKVLFDLDVLLDLMIQKFVYCGTFTCGDTFFFPQQLGS